MPETPSGTWIRNPETRRLVDALQQAGGQVRFVGGCVRDDLLGQPVGDIDLATTLLPEVVMAALEKAGIKVVATGLQHGTVTAVIDENSWEITTLRRDVATDGRHATVNFTEDWKADAARRDLTINAMSRDPDGALHDYFDGKGDLKAGRIRFVGDPWTRIREDYLRLLRLFRMHAYFGRVPLDKNILEACRDLAPGMAQLSGERVRTELFRLLAAPRPINAVRQMTESGVMAETLPGFEITLERFTKLVRIAGTSRSRSTRINDAARDPLLRFATLAISGETDADRAAERLRLANQEQKRLHAAVSLSAPAPDSLRATLYRHGREAVLDGILLAWAADGGSGNWRQLFQRAARLKTPTLPVSSRDAAGRGVAPGPEMGALLKEIEVWWLSGNCVAGRRVCLTRLDALVRDAAARD